jgi:hypothetical protein
MEVTSYGNGLKNVIEDWEYDAFWIEKCTCLLSTTHGPGFLKGNFLKMLHR